MLDLTISYFSFPFCSMMSFCMVRASNVAEDVVLPFFSKAELASFTFTFLTIPSSPGNTSSIIPVR